VSRSNGNVHGGAENWECRKREVGVQQYRGRERTNSGGVAGVEPTEDATWVARVRSRQADGGTEQVKRSVEGMSCASERGGNEDSRRCASRKGGRVEWGGKCCEVESEMKQRK